MSLKHIILELARTPDYPNGSSEMGYRFYAPLDGDGYIDESTWNKEKDKCTVLRFWKGEKDERGHLVRHSKDIWLFDYDPTKDNDDEPIFRFAQHRFVEGEYVSITEHDGVQRPFKVVKVA
jgi:hypothetical protein